MTHTAIDQITWPRTAKDHWCALKADFTAYGGAKALMREQSLWAIAWFRFGSILDALKIPFIGKPLLAIWWFFFRWVEMFTGVSLPLGCKIGGGLRIWHFGGIFVNAHSRIGQRCTLRHGVTIGNRKDDGLAPTIGDDVDIGAGAHILGDVTVGHRARIGAMSMVITDVPPGATAVGIPARIKLAATAQPSH